MLALWHGTGAVAQGQDMDFTATSGSVNFSGQDVAISSALDKSGDTFTWTQNNTGTPLTMAFSINGISGNWDESTSLGNLTYNMAMDGESSTLVLIGGQSGISLALTFQISGGTDENYTFSIDNITYR